MSRLLFLIRISSISSLLLVCVCVVFVFPTFHSHLNEMALRVHAVEPPSPSAVSKVSEQVAESASDVAPPAPTAPKATPQPASSATAEAPVAVAAGVDATPVISGMLMLKMIKSIAKEMAAAGSPLNDDNLKALKVRVLGKESVERRQPESAQGTGFELGIC
jgi:hypothetical protein